MSNVRGYKDQEIIAKVKSLPSFQYIPKNYWLVGVRSDEDAFNLFDDKLYLFKNDKCVAVWRGTTNAGNDLLNPTNKRGEAVLKADGIYYDSHTRRKHRGKVMAYCQAKPLPIHRDNDKDRRTEELGKATFENVGINIHPSSYQAGSTAARSLINAWSQGCSVFAVRADFDKFMQLTAGQQNLTYCLLKEFEPKQTSATASPNSPTVKTPSKKSEESDIIPAVEQSPNDNATEHTQIESPTALEQSEQAEAMPPTSLPKQDICKERVSTFTRIWTAILAAFGALTGFGINLELMFNRAVEGISGKHVAFLLFAGLLITLAIWLYDRSANRANKLNQAKLEIAANPNLITTELNANKTIKGN